VLRLGRKILVSLASTAMLTAALIAAAPAAATFHEIKVREMAPGTGANPNAGYVELQMYAGGQNHVHSGTLRIYDASGTMTDNFTPPTDVGNGTNQSAVLIADDGYATLYPSAPAPDATDAALNLSAGGGAACWPVNSSPIDCVSWGSFTGSLPSPAGSPFQGSGASGAIADGKAIIRSISAGCTTFLEDSDDTNDSATDFSEASPAPRDNASPILEMPCFNAPAGGGPTTVPGTTFNLRAAIAKCKKKFPKGPRRKKCIRKAKQRAQA
jgi:hypothetical protein